MYKISVTFIKLKNIMKKRKLEKPPISPPPKYPNKCDICFNFYPSTVNCFHNCTIKTCTECMIPQIKVKRIIGPRYHGNNIFYIYYKCSQCQQFVRYLSFNTRSKVKTSKDLAFSNWCRLNPCILESIVDKVTNETLKLPSRITNYDDEDDEYTTFQPVHSSSSSSSDYVNARYTSPIPPPPPSDLPIPAFITQNPILVDESNSSSDEE